MSGSRKGPKVDIPVWELGPLVWRTPGEARDSLARLYPQVLAKAEDSIRWYLRKARSKRTGARLLRLGSIGMVFLSSLMPLLSQLVRDGNGGLIIPPGWASVPMIAAGGLIALDKYFGCSSGWIRFISAGLRLQEALTSFQIEWQAGVAAWKNPEAPDADEVQSMLARARGLLRQVDDVVVDETRIWAAEFSSILKTMEESTKALVGSVKTGGKTRDGE